MRRCCEETLRVLRRHKEFLLTIIEVFIHDPLYKWALTARAAQKRQADMEIPDSEVTIVEENVIPEGLVANADAERSLLRIRQKLDGFDGGKLCQHSPADSSSNLCKAQLNLNLAMWKTH